MYMIEKIVQGGDKMRALLEDSAAILIDMQERLVPVMNQKEEVVKNSIQLITGLNILEVPIFVTRQYPKGLGDTIPEIKAALGEHQAYDKMSFSIHGDEEIKKALHESGKKNLFIFGMETHICVAQSIIDLQEIGYQTYLVSDCTTSRKESDHQVGLKRAAYEGSVITTKEAALFELLRVAQGDKFKQISKLIK